MRARVSVLGEEGRSVGSCKVSIYNTHAHTHANSIAAAKRSRAPGKARLLVH